MQKLFVDYSTVKNLINKLPSYYISQGDGGYIICSVGDSLFIQTVVLGEVEADILDFENNYKNLCTQTYSADDALVLGSISNNIPLVQPRTSNGLMRTSSEKTEIGKKNFFTHNWADSTTWYTESVYVENEIPTTSDNVTYQLGHVNVIDTFHGKIFLEDFLKDSSSRSYRVLVKVNNVTKSEIDPHTESGDFLVNYALGRIVFNSSLLPSDEVKVTYHYATTSAFYIRPDVNKKINISVAEVQFSEDIVLNDSIVFQVYGYVDVFAPHLVGALESGTKIPLEDPVIYKTISDFQCDAFKAYPSYPVISSSTWRGMNQKLMVFDWDYISSTSLFAKYGMEIKVSLEHDCAYGGSYASASFYCVSENF